MSKEVQYPQVQAPLFVPVVPAPTWFETLAVQKFPRRWAQQPDAYSGPVMMIPAPAVTRRRWAWVS